MGALSKIRAAGFGVSLVDGFIEIDPASKLTSSQREFLKLHKAEIVEELQAANLGALPQVKQAETDTAANDPTKMIVASCGQCIHFKRFNDHGRGAGICKDGIQSPGVNWWSDTQHQCDKFTTKFVICYNPLGKAFEVEARDAEHAAFLIRMNPKP